MDDGFSARVHGVSSPVALARRYETIRGRTESLAAPLTAEDQCVQSMPDAKPGQSGTASSCHLVLRGIHPTSVPRQLSGVRRGFSLSVQLRIMKAVGARHPRPMRGLLTRPETSRVAAYRAHVDAAVLRFLPRASHAALSLIELGLQHEQQHQELLVTDMLDAFSKNPLAPALMPD